MTVQPAAPVPDLDEPLTPLEDALARNHAAVLERLAREGVPIPPAPSHSP